MPVVRHHHGEKALRRLPRFRKYTVESRKDWTPWITPVMDGYLLACCDCKLVHRMQFRSFVEKNRNKRKGTFEIVHLPKEVRVSFRVKREQRMTLALRKKEGRNPDGGRR